MLHFLHLPPIVPQLSYEHPRLSKPLYLLPHTSGRAWEVPQTWRKPICKLPFLWSVSCVFIKVATVFATDFTITDSSHNSTDIITNKHGLRQFTHSSGGVLRMSYLNLLVRPGTTAVRKQTPHPRVHKTSRPKDQPPSN